MIDWNDIVRGRMKINYRRYWMRLRISLGSEGSRWVRAILRDDTRGGGDG